MFPPEPEEPSSPLIKELETKLQERRDKNKTGDENNTGVTAQKDKANEDTADTGKTATKPPQQKPIIVVTPERKSAPVVVEKQTESGATEGQVEKLRSEIAQLRTENIKLREKASENDELKKIESDKSELEQKIRSLEDSYQQLQTQEQETSKAYKELKKAVSQEGNRLNDEVRVRLGLAIKERQNILTSFEEISKMCCSLATKLDNVESSKQSAKDDIVPRVEILDESQKLMNKDVTTLRHHLDELELRIIRLEVDKDDVEVLNSGEIAAFEDMKKENSALLAKIKKLEVELEGKKANLLRVENEKALMSSQLSVLMTEVENLKRKMDELSVAHGEKEAELENSLRKQSTLNEEIKVQGIKVQTMTSLVKEKEEVCNKTEKKLREAKKLNEELMKR